ncbi:MAG: hypothetical protein NVS3B21_35120 [Acidimicrobiales bacterium]
MRTARLLTALSVTPLVMMGAAGSASAAPATSPVYSFPTGGASSPTAVAGAWSSLSTSGAGATMTLHTSALPAGDAVTIWWVVFNNPSACAGGHFGFHCGPADLNRPVTQPSVLYAAGHVIGANGVGNYGARLQTGDTTAALFGPGLVNPTGADIHLVVHDHGAADPSLMPEQIHSFGVCNSTCTDVQFSVHEQ